MKERVVVAMSGGVDSSVAAALLKNEGYEVIGLTMCFNLADSTAKRPICCGIQGIEDARRVAHKLGIKHYVLNLQTELEKWVIKDFLEEYLNGRTPNPCIRCNQYLKFGSLLKKAYSLDAKYLSTGHYARIVKVRNQQDETYHYFLKKAKDKLKDQSYFLYRLCQEQLKHIIFPLGNYTKAQVRDFARDFGLPVADKLASQEICFLSDTDYRRFLKHRLHRFPPKRFAPQILAHPPIVMAEVDSPMHYGEKNTDYTDIKPGLVVDKQGNILGQHKGIPFYTIGQREGLGIAQGYPVYITKIDPKNNKIIIGKKEDVYKSEFLVKDAHFVFKPINPVRNIAQANNNIIVSNGVKKKVALRVRIRYNHPEALAEVVPFGNFTKVRFKKPQFAIAPGQSAVFYERETVVGGGIIYSVLE